MKNNNNLQRQGVCVLVTYIWITLAQLNLQRYKLKVFKRQEFNVMELAKLLLAATFSNTCYIFKEKVVRCTQPCRKSATISIGLL